MVPESELTEDAIGRWGFEHDDQLWDKDPYEIVLLWIEHVKEK
jgi:hypothetical protein